MVNNFLRKYLEEKTIFDIEDITGINGEPLIRVLMKSNYILINSSPEDFNIKYLKYRIEIQQYDNRNSTSDFGVFLNESCTEFLNVLYKVERMRKNKLNRILNGK